MFDDVGKIAFHVVTALVDIIDDVQKHGDIAGQQSRRRVENQFPVHNPENIQDLFIGDILAAATGHLVQKAQGIAHASARFPGDQGEAFRRNPDSLALTELSHMPGDGLQIDSAELMALTT